MHSNSSLGIKIAQKDEMFNGVKDPNIKLWEIKLPRCSYAIPFILLL